MSEKTPLVVYKDNKEGKTERIVIGECEVNSDGILIGRITEDADEHTYKAVMGNGGEFVADISTYAPGAKWVMRQNASDGTPKKP